MLVKKAHLNRKPKMVARSTMRKFALDVAMRLEEIGCDPITLLALYALGDVVTLGYMTKEEYLAKGEMIRNKQGDAIIIQRSGMSRAAEYIPASIRTKCASELASYVWAKRSAVQFINADGTDRKDTVPICTVVLPDNGKVPR